MKQLIFITLLFFVSCKQSGKQTKEISIKTINLTLETANQLVELPLQCINQEYPYKLGQVITSDADLQTPSALHPIFYGCFDWHSAVHGHWSLVRLLKEFPEMEKEDEIKQLLKKQLTKEKVRQEMLYFEKKYNKTFERTYGWAWLLKLSAELHTWNTPLARELEENLKPLSESIAVKYQEYLPKLNYPIRVGTHSNTAFGLSFAYDYATTYKDDDFKKLIQKRAKDFYMTDASCPITWEPSGYDFLSPCLEEVDVMRKVLSKDDFFKWIKTFLPELLASDFSMPLGEVSDRTDGHLVHLDGLNFSRAWCFYGLANQYDEFKHLEKLANKHLAYSFPNLVDDDYEGGHWLGSFAINAMPVSH